MENVIGVRSTPWVPKVSSWGTWWARRAQRSWWAGWIIQPASRWAGGKVWGPSRRSRWWAIPEVQVVGHLVDPGVGHPMDPEVGHPMDLEVGRLVDPEVGHLVDLEVGRLEDQVVGSSHSGRQEVDLVGVDRLDQHGSLGRSKTPG